jgi:hypothetical protein
MGLALTLVLASISWSAPPPCPPERELAARLEGVRADVVARVIEVDEGFELRVEIDGQLRTLRAPTCREAADTTVFLAELVSGGPARKPLVVPPGGVAEQIPPPPPPPLHFMALGGAELLLLPSPVPRFGVALQYDLPWVRLGLDVRTGAAVNFGGTLQTGLQVTPFFDAQLSVCRMFTVGRVDLGPCAQGGFGVVQATAFNIAAPRPRYVVAWSAGPALRAAVSILTNLEVQLYSALRFAPRINFVIDESVSVLRTGLLGLDVGAGLGVRW